MPELAPVARRGGADVYDVEIRNAMAEVLPGFQTPIYGYNGVYPGPTIRARKGRPAIVRQRNRLAFDTNVHLHGGYVPSAHDGHPMDVIGPGAGFDYTYPNDQDAAFLWYHDHAHGRTSWTLYHGLVGAYLLGDEREQELELPRGEFDVPLVLADHAFNKDGSFRYAENVDLGFRGDTLLVNGAVSPRMAVKRRIYRLRFLNASNARSYDLKLGKGRQMLQIASDGGLLESPSAGELPAAPGRADRGAGRLPRLQAGLADHPREHGGRVSRDERGDAVRRRRRRRNGGGPHAERPDADDRPAAQGQGHPPLGPLARDRLRDPVADRQQGL